MYKRQPLVIVKKKDTILRFCVDFWRLNEQNEDIDSPLSLIYETIKYLIRVKVFSTLYWLFTGRILADSIRTRA